MADFEVIVRTGGRGARDLATAVPPDLDGGNLLTVSPEEAGQTVFTLVGGTTKATVDELKAQGATEIIFRRPGKADIKKPIAFWDGKLTAYNAFHAEPVHTVKITIPSKTEIQRLTGTGRDAKEHPLYPLIKYEKQEIPITIEFPEGYDKFDEFTPEIAKRVMKALEDHHPDQDFVKALKNAAQSFGLGSKISVKFGYAPDTDMRTIYSQSQLEGAKAEGKEDDGIHTSDPHFAAYNFGEAYKSVHAALATARKLEMRILELIEEILTILAVGDPDLLAILADLEAALEQVEASKTGIISAEKKAHLRKKIQALRDEQFKHQEKASAAIGKKDQAAYDRSKADVEKIGYLIQDAEALKQIYDEMPQIHMRAAEAARNTAERIRYSRDRSKQ
ncbi:MAG: hypothetical protein HYT76_05995 [Deltaproteobacteria bacterium]|nr:hypothetical protein [Deltaproteobacteria bacterium]